jgi:hypothetical protein
VECCSEVLFSRPYLVFTCRKLDPTEEKAVAIDISRTRSCIKYKFDSNTIDALLSRGMTINELYIVSQQVVRKGQKEQLVPVERPRLSV